MIHEIFPHRFNNHYLADKDIEADDFIFHYIENSFLLKCTGDEFKIPQKRDFTEISDVTNKTFLFTLDDHSCFLIWDELKTDLPTFVYKDISFFRNSKQVEISWTSIVGFHLRNWYLQNKFCGKCGSRMQQKHDERAIICSDCNNIIFPNISPAIIVAIICNSKILLARNSNFQGGWYSLIAGYVDIGESLEEAVIREVREEVGLKVKNIRYYKSQPWPPSGSMMVGFVADADDAQAIIIDDKELSDAAWFCRENLPSYSLKLSIAGEMIERFEKGEL